MKERPIIFSGEVVKAILGGRCTQTRRVITPQPDSDGGWKPCVSIHDHNINEFCPYGQVGDRLWVRETWRLEMHSGCFDVAYKNTVWKKDAGSNPYMTKYKHLEDRTWVWRPSIFMPRWASRILLEITEVRVEKVQEIGISDAMSEGMYGSANFSKEGSYDTFRDSFRILWDSINDKRGYSWSLNPWVWAVSFKLVKDGR